MGQTSREAVDRFELTPENYAQFMTRTRSIVRNTIQQIDRQQFGTKVMDKMGLRVYTDNDTIVCTGNIMTTMTDLEYALYASTTKEVQIVAAILHNQLFKEAGLLAILNQKTIEDSFQFVGVKHLALTKKGVFAKPHQLVYLEATGTLHEDGRLRMYQVVEFVDLAHYFNVQNCTSNSIHPVCTTVTLFEANPNDVKSVKIYSSATYTKATPNHLVQMHQAAPLWQRVISLASLAVSRRLVGSTSLVQHWVPNSECKQCSVCSNPFKALRAKHHCRSCGEMMCYACSIHIQSPTVVHKYCTRCVLISRELQGADRSEHSRKQTIPNTPDSDDEYLKSVYESHHAPPIILLEPKTVSSDGLKALKKITNSIAQQESILSNMRETFEKQTKRLTVDSNLSTNTDSYLTDTDSDDMDRRFEYIET